MSRSGVLGPGAPAASADLDPDVLVVGGGLAGVAAALAATELGASVVLSEADDVLGGQLTSQLVACPDEHPLVETTGRTRTWARLRDAVRARHGGTDNPGGGWVSRICAAPADWLEELETLLEPAVRDGRLVVLTGHRPDSLLADPTVDAPTAALGGLVLTGPGGTRTTVRARVTVDATETGDVLALAGGWVIGSEGRAAFDEPDALPAPDAGAEQSVTWCAAVRLTHLDPATPPPVSAEPVAQDGEDRFSLTLDGWDGTPHVYRFAQPGPGGRPPFWTYRRLVRGAGAQVPGGDARVGDVVCLNWAANDYDATGLVADGATTRARSRQLTLDFLDWLRTSCPRHDGGRGYPGLEPAPDVSLSEDGLARQPYVREARRVHRADPLTVHDLVPPPRAERPRRQHDSVALAWYHADLHPRVGHPSSVYTPTAPAQVPVRCLLHPGRPDLIAAGKTIAATQVAAAATRVHPAEWGTGEAAGLLAALAALDDHHPRDVVSTPLGVVELQRSLLARGAPVAWLRDVPDDDPDAPVLQLLHAHGAFVGLRAATLDLRPDDPLDLADGATSQAVLAAAASVGMGEDVRVVLDRLPGDSTPRDLARSLAPLLPGRDGPRGRPDRSTPATTGADQTPEPSLEDIT